MVFDSWFGLLRLLMVGSLACPTTRVLFYNQTKETDGDRARQREGWPAAGRDVPRLPWQAMRDAAQHLAGDRR